MESLLSQTGFRGLVYENIKNRHNFYFIAKRGLRAKWGSNQGSYKTDLRISKVTGPPIQTESGGVNVTFQLNLGFR